MRETSDVFVVRHMNDSPMELYLLRDELYYTAQNYRLRIERSGESSLADTVSILEEYEEAITNLIRRREDLDGMSQDKLVYPEGFLEACRVAYEIVGPIYKARETCGCWVFRCTRDLTIGGSVGVVIESGEPVFFHVNATNGKGPVAKALAKKLGMSVKAMQAAYHAENDRLPELRVPTEYQT